jgi:hypothetical protein
MEGPDRDRQATRPIRRRVLSGPSEGFSAWTSYWLEIGDWVIDARKRWRDGDPPAHARRWGLLACCSSVAVIATIVERVVWTL